MDIVVALFAEILQNIIVPEDYDNFAGIKHDNSYESFSTPKYISYLKM